MSTTTKIDYNKVRSMIGTVVSDGTYNYVVADYSMNKDMYQIWCTHRQVYFFASYNGLHACYDVVSGTAA